MSAKHQFTPGPWVYHAEVMPETFGNRFNISQQEGAPYTPNYSDVATTIHGEKIEIQEANARLIASAPDLLEAAKTAVDVINILWVSHHANRADFALDALKAAIAKATGEDA